MSLQDLLSLAPVPGLATGVNILTSTYKEVQNVKLYKQQCRELSARCVRLMIALRDSSQGLEGTPMIEIADEIEVLVSSVDRKVREWASWTQLKSFLQQRAISEGIDRLHKDIDAAMMKFHIQVTMELSRSQLESRVIQDRDKTEMRELLQKIVKNTDNLKPLLSMQSNHGSNPVEEMMESLQTELMDPSMRPNEKEAFKASLWMLHDETSKLPPLADLTGQVTLRSSDTIRKGSFNDIYVGLWLDRESVALRLPRMLVNNPEAQQRFEREVSIWRELRHPNVVPLYGIVHIGEDIYTVSPWMDSGTVVDYAKRIPSADRMKLLTDAALGKFGVRFASNNPSDSSMIGLEYLHDKGIVHGDLRGANLLVSKDGAVRLSDFGLSKFLEDCGKGLIGSDTINPRWMAPELIKQNGLVSPSSDVWSFGMVCLELLSGEIPYSNITRDIAVLREVDNERLPGRPGRLATSRGLSDGMWALMVKCWHEKPEMRPSISDIKRRLLELRVVISPLGRSPYETVHERESKLSQTENGSLSSTADRVDSRPSTATSDISNISSISGTGGEMARQGVSGGDTLYWHRKNSNIGVELDSLRLNFLSAPPVSRMTPRVNDSQPPSPEISSSLSSSKGSASHFSLRMEAPSYDRAANKSMSSIGSTTSVPLTGHTSEAVVDRSEPVVNVIGGVVSSGNLEGLVDRLITNSNTRGDIEYRNVLLATCTDFTTPEEVFAIMSRRFYEAESKKQKHPENKIALQYNIFMIIMYWLSNDRYLQVNPNLLAQIKLFCESAIQMKSSTTMVVKARDILWQVEEKSRAGNVSPVAPLTPYRRPLQTSDVKPYDLAIALTLLEGDRYKVLTVPDYIAHLRRRPEHNKVEGVYTTKNKIILWIKDSILHYDSVDHRANVLKFFIHTAFECWKMRNFSSLVAIASALHSTAVERLRYTRAELSLQLQSKLDALQDIIDPSSNHRSYRAALDEVVNPEEKQQGIPWLAIHLKELNHVFERYPAIVRAEGRPLINFERYFRFIGRIKEVLYYDVPDLEQFRHQGQLEYLQKQLRNLELSNVSDDQQIVRSKELESMELADHRNRKYQLKNLGFRVN